MVSKELMDKYVGKKVFAKIIDDKVQVGILKKVGDDYLIKGSHHKTGIEPSQVARITTEEGDLN